jgi:glutamine amidotransferase
METSQEGGEHEGLGLMPGKVRRLEPSGGLRIPHIGRNSVHFQQAHPVLEGIPNDRDFYFAHSFGVKIENMGMVIGTTEYGGAIAAVIGQKNIIGCQFHPEKSQVHGLRVMENFCRWNGRC